MRIAWRASVRGAAVEGRNLGRKDSSAETSRGESIDPSLAEHVRRESEGAEDIGEGTVAHVQAAGKGAKRRHEQAHAVARETAPSDAAPAPAHPCDRVQVPGDLTRRTARLMTEAQRADGKHVGETAARPDRRIGVVVAGDPHPIPAARSASRSAPAMRAAPSPS